MTTQRHELEAWLGDDHGLTDEQINYLMGIADDIRSRYPDPDDADDRENALTVAHQVITAEHPGSVVDDLASELVQARRAERTALVGLRQAAVMLVADSNSESQAGFARRAGVDRMAVRDWLGKR